MTGEFKAAVLSEDGRYRYALTRTWDPAAKQMTFVMLNPSTADADIDDPTIRRCIGFAKREGCGSLGVVNVYALRATDPRELKRAIDPVGPENDTVLADVFAQALRDRLPVVAAWGTHADPYRLRQVTKLMRGLDPLCLGITKDGHPKHPLYIAGDQPLLAWQTAAAA